MSWLWSSPLLLLLAVGGCAKPTPRLEAPINSDLGGPQYSFAVSGRDLDNGFRVVAMPDDNTNLIKIDMRYRVGAAEDPDGKAGLAHLVEHLLFESTVSDADPSTIKEFLGTHALFYNAYTTWDETHYTIVAPKKQLGAMIMIESRRMRAKCESITDAQLELEREVVRNEIRQRAGVGSELASIVHRAVFPEGHAYHRAIGGTDAEITSITRQDVCDFIASYYTPGSAIMVVSGQLNAGDALRTATAAFGSIPAGPPVSRKPVAPPSLSGSSTRHRLAVEEATAFILFSGVQFTDRSLPYEQVANRLMKRQLIKLLKERSFITDVDVIDAGGVRAPLVVIAVSTDDPARLEEAVNLVFGARDKLTAGLEEVEFHAIIGKARADLLLRVEPFMSEAIAMADYLQYARHTQFIIPLLDEYAAMKLPLLIEHAKASFPRERSHVIYVVPDDSAVPEDDRAELLFSPRDYELQDWRTSVDVTEAERDVPIDVRGVRAFVRTMELDNGLRVQLAPSLGYPVVDIRLVMPGGNLHEPEGRYGLADFAASMMEPGKFTFKKATHPVIARAQFESILSVGGEISGSADATTTTLRISGLASNVHGLLWQLYWQVATASYDGKSLKTLRDITGRGDKSEDELSERKQRALFAALFGAQHPYANRGSTRALLANLSVDDLRKFHADNHRLHGATLIVAGDFNSAAVEGDIRRMFGSLPSDQAPPPRQVPPAARRSAPVYLGFADKDAIQTGLMFAFPTPARGRQDIAERQVLDSMIEFETSALREQLGASYGVSVGYFADDHGPGFVLISASVDRARAAEAYQAMTAALDDIRAGNSVAAFVRARRRVLRRLLADSIDSQSVAGELSLFASRGLGGDYWSQLAKRVATLRMSDIQAVVDRDLDARHAVVIVSAKPEAIAEVFKSVQHTNFQLIE